MDLASPNHDRSVRRGSVSLVDYERSAKAPLDVSGSFGMNDLILVLTLVRHLKRYLVVAATRILGVPTTSTLQNVGNSQPSSGASKTLINGRRSRDVTNYNGASVEDVTIHSVNFLHILYPSCPRALKLILVLRKGAEGSQRRIQTSGSKETF